MMAEVSRGPGVCSEYKRLLGECQEALFSWQQRAALIARNAKLGQRTASELKRLHSNYRQAYAELERHEHACSACQYVSQISGLDFECMSTALNEYRRTA